MSTSPSSDHTQQQFLTLPITEIKPYWRNPRRISDEAVNALVESITRYGYLQPIVVDEQGVIVIGHTRYSALKRMGRETALVAIAKGLTPLQIKELRLVDNKVGEFTQWDFEKLVSEIEDLDADMMRAFFPEVVGSGEGSASEGVVEVTVDLTPPTPNESNDEVEFVCPSCFHGWTTTVSKAEIQSGVIK